MVEQGTHKPLVVSSNLTLATRRRQIPSSNAKMRAIWPSFSFVQRSDIFSPDRYRPSHHLTLLTTLAPYGSINYIAGFRTRTGKVNRKSRLVSASEYRQPECPIPRLASPPEPRSSHSHLFPVCLQPGKTATFPPLFTFLCHAPATCYQLVGNLTCRNLNGWPTSQDRA